MSLNKVQLIGNLGQDPDVKALQSGEQVGTLSVATNEAWTDKQGEKKERVTWHRVVVWGKLAENCAKFLKKGRQVYVEGKIETREYTDKEQIKRYVTEVRAHTVQFLGGGGEGSSGGGARPPHPADMPADPSAPPTQGQQKQGSEPQFTEDDIPF